MTNDIYNLIKEYGQLPEYSESKLDGVEIVSLFGDKPINIAATRGIISEISVLLLAGADTNARGEHGYAPLHNAVEQSQYEAVRFLIANEADPKQCNDDNMSPYQLAEPLNDTAIGALLKSL